MPPSSMNRKPLVHIGIEIRKWRPTRAEAASSKALSASMVWAIHTQDRSVVSGTCFGTNKSIVDAFEDIDAIRCISRLPAMPSGTPHSWAVWIDDQPRTSIQARLIGRPGRRALISSAAKVL
jgi:hypothetical protein